MVPLCVVQELTRSTIYRLLWQKGGTPGHCHTHGFQLRLPPSEVLQKNDGHGEEKPVDGSGALRRSRRERAPAGGRVPLPPDSGGRWRASTQLALAATAINKLLYITCCSAAGGGATLSTKYHRHTTTKKEDAAAAAGLLPLTGSAAVCKTQSSKQEPRWRSPPRPRRRRLPSSSSPAPAVAPRRRRRRRPGRRPPLRRPPRSRASSSQPSSRSPS